MKILEKFIQSEPVQRIEVNTERLYQEAGVKSNNPESGYTIFLDGGYDAALWSESKFKKQAFFLIEKLGEMNPKFIELKQYFEKPNMPGMYRNAIDLIKETAERIYFQLEAAKERGINIQSYNPFISTAIFNCAPGGLDNLQKISMTLEVQIEAMIYNTKYEYIQDLAAKFINEKENYGNGVMHVHQVDELINATKLRYHTESTHSNGQVPEYAEDFLNIVDKSFTDAQTVSTIVAMIANKLMMLLPDNEAVKNFDPTIYNINQKIIESQLRMLNPNANTGWILNSEDNDSEDNDSEIYGYTKNYIQIIQAMVVLKLEEDGYIEGAVVKYKDMKLILLSDGVYSLNDDVLNSGFILKEKCNYKAFKDLKIQNQLIEEYISTNLVTDINNNMEEALYQFLKNTQMQQIQQQMQQQIQQDLGKLLDINNIDKFEQSLRLLSDEAMVLYKHDISPHQILQYDADQFKFQLLLFNTEKLEEALFFAINEYGVEEVKQVLNKASEVNDNKETLKRILNYEDHNKLTPLIKAIESGNLEVVQIILEAAEDIGINILNTETYCYNKHPLDIAIRFKDIKILKVILKAAKSTQSLTEMFGHAANPLIKAIESDNIEMVEVILEAAKEAGILSNILLHHVPVMDLVNPYRVDNPLIKAVKTGNVLIAKVILEAAKEAGIIILDNISNNDAEDILIEAIRSGHIEMIQVVLKAAKEANILPKILNNQYNLHTPINIAVESGNLEMVQVVLEAAKEADILLKVNLETLNRAIECGNINILKVILEIAKSTQILSEMLKNTLQNPLINAINGRDIEIVKVILKAMKECDVNYYVIPLIQAIEDDNIDIVKVILKAVESESAILRDIFDRVHNPLIEAIEHGNIEIVKVILEAIESKTDILHNMFNRVHNPLIEAINKHNIDIVKVIAINHLDCYSIALKQVASQRNIEMVEVILEEAKEAGILLDLLKYENDDIGMNNLIYAIEICSWTNANIEQHNMSIKIVKAMLEAAKEAGILLDILNHEASCKWTPIMAAIMRNDLETVKNILQVAKEAGVVHDVLNYIDRHDKSTPLMQALSKKEIVKEILMYKNENEYFKYNPKTIEYEATYQYNKPIIQLAFTFKEIIENAYTIKYLAKEIVVPISDSVVNLLSDHGISVVDPYVKLKESLLNLKIENTNMLAIHFAITCTGGAAIVMHTLHTDFPKILIYSILDTSTYATQLYVYDLYREIIQTKIANEEEYSINSIDDFITKCGHYIAINFAKQAVTSIFMLSVSASGGIPIIAAYSAFYGAIAGVQCYTMYKEMDNNNTLSKGSIETIIPYLADGIIIAATYQNMYTFSLETLTDALMSIKQVFIMLNNIVVTDQLTKLALNTIPDDWKNTIEQSTENTIDQSTDIIIDSMYLMYGVYGVYGLHPYIDFL